MLSHHFTFGADLVFFTWLIWQVADGTAQSRRRWGALGLVVLGCLLILLDPTRHILLDHGGVFFEEKSLAMYKSDGTLSPAGRSCQVATIAGLLLLFLGLVCHLQLPAKVCGSWLTPRAYSPMA